MNRTICYSILLWTIALQSTLAAQQNQSTNQIWKLGDPIVTYWAGPPLTDTVAHQMADGGWNLVWCKESELDIAHRHGLRAQLQDGLISPANLEDPAKKEKLDALVDRVKNHPALYSYFITDEPNATNFPSLGRLVSYLRERDPSHLAYINLFPTYASNAQLGNKGDTVTAYNEHLRQYIDIVKPALISYDHYQFAVVGDATDYFLNLALIRRASLQAELPFLNIVQACTWSKHMRVPVPDEMRYLVYTTIAYGAQGISYYVYCHPNHVGMIVQEDGTPTERYHVLKTLNREFAAIVTQLKPYQSLGVYHAGMLPPGAVPLPKDAPFRPDPPVEPMDYKTLQPVKGVLLGYFGQSKSTEKSAQPTHCVVVNLDYKAEAKVGLTGPGKLEIYDALLGLWTKTSASRCELRLPKGGGTLVRIEK